MPPGASYAPNRDMTLECMPQDKSVACGMPEHLGKRLPVARH